MIVRDVETTIRELREGYPVICITGPRQSGKTTLARFLFETNPYVSFENPDIRQRFVDDPRNFLKQYENGAIFDEAQRVPELFSYLQQIVDQGPNTCRFVITGSQQFGLVSTITQSLAGRSAVIQLLPFSLRERYPQGINVPTLDQIMFTGLYPPVHDRDLEPVKWYAQYVSTYIERDLRQLITIRDLSVFQRFLRLCAARCGQLLNLSNLASDTGVSHTTIRAWLSILEASYVIFLLPPYFENFGKRLIKSPKLYFYDTGLVCWLLSIGNEAQLNIHPYRGAIFESFVISELVKSRYNQGLPSDYYFWRDRSGLEIDVIYEQSARHHVLEIKSSSTFNPDFVGNIQKWRNLIGAKAGSMRLVYGGLEPFDFHNVRVSSWLGAGSVRK